MKRHRFTLIEMLVVVGIIAVLAGLLFPVLAHSRASGLQTKCMNNHQQIIKAMGIYADENGGQMIMKNHGKSGAGYTYATILNGIDEGDGSNDYRTKSYVPKEALVCTISKEVLVTQERKDDRTSSILGENAIGIINPIHLSGRNARVTNETSGWLNESTKADSSKKYYQTMGRFVNVPENDDKTVTFVTDRMKNPGGLVIFADTFRQGGRRSTTKLETFWLFEPRDKTDDECYVTTAHQDRCPASFADGHVKALDAGQLRDCGTEILKFLGSNLEKHNSSDTL